MASGFNPASLNAACINLVCAETLGAVNPLLFPAFFVLGIVFVFQDWLSEIQEDYSFYTWLFLIVFIDVAHVYSTLFKTYFVKSEFQRRKKLYIGLPIICFLIGLFLFGLERLMQWFFVWNVLAFENRKIAECWVV